MTGTDFKPPMLRSVGPEMRDFAQGRGGWKKITAGIWLILRGLFYPSNEEIGQKNHSWTGAKKVLGSGVKL
jgi:hypothetical protein